MLIKIRPPYKVRMRQDPAHTRAHDTYGTITQQSAVIWGVPDKTGEVDDDQNDDHIK